MTRLLLEIIGGSILVAALTGWWFEHNQHEQQIGIAECDAKADAAVKIEESKQAADAVQYETQLKEAKAQHDREIADINGRISVIPIRMCDASPVRGSKLPAATASPAGVAPSAGGTFAGPGDDLRPAIEAFKARIETVVADCRAALAEWPPPPAP